MIRSGGSRSSAPGRAQPSQNLPRAEGWGNPVAPSPCGRARPSRGQGRGETRLPHAPGAYVHVRRGAPREPPGGRRRGRRRRGGEPCPYPGPPPGRGCALPNPPAGGGVGKPGFPVPLPQQLIFTSGGVRPGNLRAGDTGAGGVGAGKPRPYAGPPPGRGCALPNPPAGGGVGKPGFPTPLAEGVCSPQADARA